MPDQNIHEDIAKLRKHIRWACVNLQDAEEIIVEIDNIVASHTARLLEEIEGMKKNTKTEFEVGSEMSTPRIVRDNGYNQALSDIKSLITKQGRGVSPDRVD